MFDHQCQGVADAAPDRVLVLKRTFDAPRPIVFAAWSRAEHVAQWWGPKAFTAPHCEVHFAVGGDYKICMRGPDGTDHWVWGEYLEIEEPERIVFTWNREDSEGNPRFKTVVTVLFEEADGKTVFTLHQAAFATQDDRDEHQGGWTECLARLDTFVVQATES